MLLVVLSLLVLFVGVLLTRIILVPLDLLHGLHVPMWLLGISIVALLTWCLGDP
ncbi:MAG: hypothetical protein KME43_04040 [Myxacorys chilensis ATA2-1-KO14]|jgi:hypothetical protein|nr:hypothetical protein [Myxacorys chilensis ATA2-1-KO14]